MKDYQKLALKTDHKSYNHVAARFTPSMSRLIHAALGLSTESNEFADALKKHLIYGKELDKTNLIEELGDICWFLALACDELGTDFDKIMEINLNKLKARYGDKYSDEKAINRDLEKERKILNKQKQNGGVNNG